MKYLWRIYLCCVLCCGALLILSSQAVAEMVDAHGEAVSLSPQSEETPSDEVQDQDKAEDDISPDIPVNLLEDVLRHAFVTNPELEAGRAELQAVQEALPQAFSGLQPTITGSADITYQDIETEGGNAGTSGDDDGVSKQAGIDVVQPIFRGGRTSAAISGANNLIAAQEASLDALHQDVFTRAVTAYMDVYQDQAIVGLRENNQALLTRQLEATQDRFDVGELTRTDVSQAQARLARADADLTAAKADLRQSQSGYENIMGVWPDRTFDYPQTPALMPNTLDDILYQSIHENPQILSSEFLSLQAQDNTDEVFGELLPTLEAVGAFNKLYDPVPGTFDDQQSATAGLRLSVPLYQAGSVRSRIREAKKTASQRSIEVLTVKRSIRSQAIAAWEALKAAQAQILSREAQVEAATIAREGVNFETEFGERTVLDSLDAEQELLDAQVALITSKRDEIVAKYNLMSIMGLLTPAKLGFLE